MIKAGEHISHAYMIASQSPTERDGVALRLAAAMLCTGAGDRPCGVCRACRLALGSGHPDIIPIRRLTDEKGKLKRGIQVEQIRAVVADAQARPTEADKKVYIIYEAELMNTQAQNALLKLLEEPPASSAFILSAANPSLLLPTVRSRCVSLRFNTETEETGESREAALELLRLVARGDRAKLLSWCMDKAAALDLRATAEFIAAARTAAAECVCGSAAQTGLSRERAAALSDLLERCGTYLKVNTGTRHIFGLLAVDAISK